MLKFMAWERMFEARILNVRNNELKFQRLTFTIEVSYLLFQVLTIISSRRHFLMPSGDSLCWRFQLSTDACSGTHHRY
jgi:hypothetical protein